MPPTQNASGQTYPWAIEGRDFNAYDQVERMMNFTASASEIIGQNKNVVSTQDTLNRINEEFDDLEDENGKTERDKLVEDISAGKYAGAHMEKNKIVIKPTDKTLSYKYCTNESQTRQLQGEFNKLEKILNDSAEAYRNKYKGRYDEDGRLYDQKANELADWFEDVAKVYNPKSGNIIEADFHAPYLSYFNALSAASPKFDTMGLEAVVDGLNQKGVPGGVPLYDDYMTLMKAGVEETKIQFERQKGEAEGWNAEKEQKYLNDLRASHAKIAEAYDRIWEVNDNGQYDKYLNNQLDHMVGKLKATETRDCNDAMGYMKGEIRAIDLGYDSKHLHILAQVGLQEQVLRKQTSDLKLRIEEEKDPEKLKKYQEDQKRLDEYKADFNALKEAIWDARPQTQEDMQKVGATVDAFFESHQEKYADFQNLHSGYKATLDYSKEEASKAGPMPTPIQDELSNKPLSAAASTLFMSYGDTQAMEDYVSVTGADKFVNGKYTPEADAHAKEVARGLSDKIADRMAEAAEDAMNKRETAQARLFEVALLGTVKSYADNFAKGVPIGPQSRFKERTFEALQSIQAHMPADAFSPEKIASTQKAVVELGLNDFAERAIKLQELHQDFDTHIDQMTADERAKAIKELNENKEAMIKQSKDMLEKMKNPSQDVKNLFVKDSQLQDIMGSRGLQGIIDRYTEDLQKIDMGIALCHMCMGLEEKGVKAEVVIGDPGIEIPAGVEYIVSVRV